MSRTIIGVMGPGKASEEICDTARRLGKFIAGNNWVLLTGGRNVGVMDAASEGATKSGGTVVGILPGNNRQNASKFVDIPICTGVGAARNNINILSSDIVVSCGTGAGTTSEIMLALKSEKPVILLHPSEKLVSFLTELPYSNYEIAETPEQAIAAIKSYL